MRLGCKPKLYETNKQTSRWEGDYQTEKQR